MERGQSAWDSRSEADCDDATALVSHTFEVLGNSVTFVTYVSCQFEFRRLATFRRTDDSNRFRHRIFFI